MHSYRPKDISDSRGRQCNFKFLISLRPKGKLSIWKVDKSLVFLLISKFTNRLHLHKFSGTETTEANKFLKTDANGAERLGLILIVSSHNQKDNIMKTKSSKACHKTVSVWDKMKNYII